MKTIYCALIILFSASLIEARTFYIKQNEKGNGTSWEDASGNLSAILLAAKFGDEIWVTKGIYYPTENTNREISFIINDGIKMYGGFTGSEKKLSQRNWKKNKTILSGEIGSKAFSDNSLSVIYVLKASSETIINGFSISGGCANQKGLTGESKNSGGGLYNNGAGITNYSNPIILNCEFLNNYAQNGAAVYNNGMNNGNANPIFINCQFINNQAEFNGGAFFNNGQINGQSNPILKACIFQSNEANQGGAFMNYGAIGRAHPLLIRCLFENNVAYNKGGSIFNLKKTGRAFVACQDCKFIDNVPRIKTIFEDEMVQTNKPKKLMN